MGCASIITSIEALVAREVVHDHDVAGREDRAGAGSNHPR